MEHPQPPPSTATSHSKLRLMCSYGGHIIPRPNFKSLCYFGGDNRIVAVDRRITTTVSSFTAHISAILLIHQPFAVKYHLPHHDLDSLISVATDDDLLIMFDEHDRLASSPTPSRVRIFLFPLKQQQPQPQPPRAQQQQQLANSPTDSWFSDALKSAKIMRRKDGFRDSGLSGGVDTACVEAQNEITTQESLVLETSSSFGSTSSSGSSSNSPPIWVRVEEGGINLQDSKVKFPKPDLILSQSDSASGISHTKTGINQDSVVDVASMDSRISSPQTNISSASSAQVYAPVQVSGYPISAQLAQPPPPQQQQQMQFIQASSHYNYPTGPLSISSNSPMYHHPQLHYQSQAHYRPSQAYPIYVVPVNQTQPYNLSVQSNMIDTATTAAPSRPLMHSNVDLIPPQMASKEVTTTMPAPELAAKVYRASPATIPVHAPSTQNQQQPAGLQQVHHAPPPQSVATSLMEANSNGTNVGDDPAYNLIYKSQPPAPSMPSQFQTMAGAKALLLAGGFDEAACK